MMPPDPQPEYPESSRDGISILFVCTGNTCRSPLAEALCRRMLAARLGCAPAELPSRGVVVRSAGVAAWPGDAASPLAVDVAQEYDADLTTHRSRPVNPELLTSATQVIAMTRAHAAALAVRYPQMGPEPILLTGPDQDLEDPIGGDLAIYRACAETIRLHLDRLLPGWVAGLDRLDDCAEPTGT